MYCISHFVAALRDEIPTDNANILQA